MQPNIDSNEFPCSFNLTLAQKLTLTKLRTVKRTLAVELENGDDCESELIRKKNLLSWIYFRLEMLEKSVELSNELDELTQGRNIVALGNRCYIMWRSGDELNMKTCLNCLKNLKNDENFHKLFTEAKAEQAYSYSRLGGPDNLRQAEQLFSQVVAEEPTNYLWKYGLGLVSFRATHGNIFCSSPKSSNLDTFIKNAIQCFFEVADNGESWLKSMAYAELLSLRQVYGVGQRPEYDGLFRHLSITNLVDKALENNGINIPSVLTKCGKALCWINFNKSIDLLEKSVQIKPSSTSYHFLGKSYRRKAQMQAKNNHRLCVSSGDIESDGGEQSIEGRAATETDGGGQSTEGKVTTETDGGEQSTGGRATTETDGGEQSTEGRATTETDGGEQLTEGRATTATDGGEQSTEGRVTTESDGGEQSLEGRATTADLLLAEKKKTSSESSRRKLYNQHGGNRQVYPATCQQVYQSAYISWTDELQVGTFPDKINMLDILPPSQDLSSHVPLPQDLSSHVPLPQDLSSHLISPQRPSPAAMSLDTVNRTSYATLVHTYRGCHYYTPLCAQPSAWSPRGKVQYNLGQYDQQVLHEHSVYSKNKCDGRSIRLGGRTNSFPSRRSSPSANASIRGYQINRPNDSCRGRGQSSRAPQFYFDNSSQYDQAGYSEHRGRSHSFRAGNTYSRSFSTPPTTKEANRRYQRARGNARLRGRVHELGTSLQGHEITACSRKPSNQVYLSVDDESVKKAVNCFKEAIKLSSENFPAIVDLGILLRETGQESDSLKQFNIVTNSHLSSRSHRVTVITAYEQAGLCYLELSKTNSPDPEYKEYCKLKLTQAVSLAAELTLTMPELQGKVQGLWTAFDILMRIIDGEQSSPNYFKTKVKLLELAQNYRHIIDIFKNIPALTGNELSDKDIVTAAFKSYLNLNQFENALALQNIIALRPDVRESDWWKNGSVLDMRITVLLHAISGRLKNHTGQSENPISLFQQIFQISFGTCFGARDCDDHNQSVENLVGDVLIVFNDDEEVDESPDSSTVFSLCLQQIIASLFGLETSRNLKGNANFGGSQRCLQLEEMSRYQVVIIILGSEKRDRIFDEILNCVVSHTNQRILILDAGLKDGQVPRCLVPYDCFKRQDISGLRNIDPSFNCGARGDQISYNDILTHGFHGDIDAVLELFCFVTGQKWPRL